MTTRRRAALVASLAALATLTLAACQTDPPPSGCRLARKVALNGTALTLLPDARIDWIGDTFVLIGYDGRVLRWAGLDLDGHIGVESGVPLPEQPVAGMGPWFGVAGDAIVMAYGVPGAQAGMVDIRGAAAPRDGAAAAVPAGVLATVSDGTPLVMGSSRAGGRAALAWWSPDAGQVVVQLVDNRGAAAGAPIMQSAGSGTPDVSCVSFVPGRDELTVGYLRQVPPADRNPSWTTLEVREAGTAEAPLGLPLGTVAPTCPLTMPTTAGYGVAWQNVLGSFVGSYDRGTNMFSSTLFEGAVAFGGADLQPPLVGIGPAGADTAVVFAKPGAAEAWRVDTAGNLTEQALVFPSVAGQLGQVSAVPVGGALYATYADYTDAVAGVGTMGQRFFVKVSCF